MGTREPDNLVEQLRRAVGESGETLYRVAKDSGLSYAALLRFMARERGLTLDSAAKLTDLLGLELRRIRGKRQARIRDRDGS